MKYLCIDPSGTGTTGIFFFQVDGKSKHIFSEYKSKKWEEHLNFIAEIVKIWKPDIIIYENTTYIYGRQHQGTVGLYKLIGGLVALKYAFNFIQKIDSIAVNQIKPFKDKLFAGHEKIEGLTCKIGRGKGWKYKRQKISLHQLDKNEIENKLKDFKEGQDYSISPTDEPNIKTYNFHNDKLRSMFRDDRVPVRITREAYDGKDYTYRGHFEEGKDYNYSAQSWDYGQDYQGDGGVEDMPDWMRPVFADRIEGISKHSKIEVNGKSGNFHTGKIYWERSWTYDGKGNGNQEPKKIESNFTNEIENHRRNLQEFKLKRELLVEDAHKLKERYGSYEKAKPEITELENRISKVNQEIRYHQEWLVKNGGDNSELARYHLCQNEWSRRSSIPHLGCWVCGKWIDTPHDDHYYCKNDGAAFCSSNCYQKVQRPYHSGCEEIVHLKGKHSGNAVDIFEEFFGKENQFRDNKNSDLHKENQELRQQLTEVQKQLAEVLAELKKLKININGKGGEKLEQQIVKNERLIKNGENISVAEIQEQVNKSQALMNELNTNVSTSKDNKGNGSLPYIIGGSVILAVVGVIGYLVVKKNKRK